MNILVTGSSGFVGRNLMENLKNIRDGKDCTRPGIKGIYGGKFWLCIGAS